MQRRHLLALSSLIALPTLPAVAADALLTVNGGRLGPPAREGRFDFDLAALERLPQRRLVTATPWYSERSAFAGPLLRDVLRAAGAPDGAAGALRCTALNDYRVEIPLEDVRRWDVVLAHRLNDRPMSVREKGPLFVIYPFDDAPALRTSTYYARCIWQLRKIELTA